MKSVENNPPPPGVVVPKAFVLLLGNPKIFSGFGKRGSEGVTFEFSIGFFWKMFTILLWSADFSNILILGFMEELLLLLGIGNGVLLLLFKDEKRLELAAKIDWGVLILLPFNLLSLLEFSLEVGGFFGGSSWVSFRGSSFLGVLSGSLVGGFFFSGEISRGFSVKLEENMEIFLSD